MKKNVGISDKVIRVFIASIVFVLLFAKLISGVLAVLLFILALTLVLTSIKGFCPLYSFLGINTNRKKARL